MLLNASDFMANDNGADSLWENALLMTRKLLPLAASLRLFILIFDADRAMLQTVASLAHMLLNLRALSAGLRGLEFVGRARKGHVTRLSSGYTENAHRTTRLTALILRIRSVRNLAGH